MSVPSMFNQTLQQTADWLQGLTGEESISEERQAYAALRAVLHQLRDRLTIEEATDLAAQLPLLVRGIYYEGWSPAHKPEKIRHSEEFVDGVRSKLDGHPEIDPESAIRAVFRVLTEKVTPGEIKQVIGMLPKELQGYWPTQYQSGSA